jgi:hypothetical protein
MRDVKVNVASILKRIKANREEHLKIVEEAWVGYIKNVTAELSRMHNAFKEGRRFRAYIGLTAPQDHTKDYDAVIDMLESSTEAEIMLNQQDFRAYVRDEWSWMGQFLHSNSAYSLSATEKMSALNIEDE